MHNFTVPLVDGVRVSTKMPHYRRDHLFLPCLINVQERSTKQLNLMVTPADKTLKVITATIQNVLEWKQFQDKMAVIYEIFGKHMDLQILYIHNVPGLEIPVIFTGISGYYLF